MQKCRTWLGPDSVLVPTTEGNLSNDSLFFMKFTECQTVWVFKGNLSNVDRQRQSRFKVNLSSVDSLQAFRRRVRKVTADTATRKTKYDSPYYKELFRFYAETGVPFNVKYFGRPAYNAYRPVLSPGFVGAKSPPPHRVLTALLQTPAANASLGSGNEIPGKVQRIRRDDRAGVYRASHNCGWHSACEQSSNEPSKPGTKDSQDAVLRMPERLR